MSEQREWRQEGEGKHPTLAGNIFDPNSSGANTGSGSGLTGSNSGSGLTGSSGTGLSGNDSGSGLTGSSESGLSGSNSATSGLTGSSATRTAEDGSSSSTGYVQSALNMVGLGGSSTSRESDATLGGAGGARQPDIVRDFETAPPTGGAGSDRAGFGAAETGDLSGGRSGSGITGVTGRDAYNQSEGTSTSGSGGDYDNVKDRDSGSGLTGASALGAGALGSGAHEGSQGRSTSNSGLDRRDEGVSGNSIGDNSNVGDATQSDTRRTARDVTSDRDSEITDRAAREQVADESNRESDDPRTGGAGKNQETSPDATTHSASLKNNPAEDKKAATRENTSSIPTAGGERLGKKHWGESKVVPDNPKPQSEAGVQSSDNDPTTSSNTAANTGGATGPPGSHNSSGSGEKEGVVDKIKDKLHMGGSS